VGVLTGYLGGWVHLTKIAHIDKLIDKKLIKFGYEQ
jgi:hypothetical protein